MRTCSSSGVTEMSRTSTSPAPLVGFLTEDASWQAPYFADGNNKQRQRVLFTDGVEASNA